MRLEDGVFVWYSRGEVPSAHSAPDVVWDLVGPLNPQPGSREGKPKRRRKASTPEERKARKNYTIRTPKGEENILPEMMELAREKLQKAMGSDKLPPPYITTVAALKELIDSA